MENIIVKLENVSKKYNDKYAVKNINLEIYKGEFITLLGASGCGKTTILRMISGLETTTEGKVYIDGEDVTNEDARKRKVNTIFQNYALFPHMTVKENISFGLRMKKQEKEEIEKQVNKMIKLVKLEGLEERLPSQLSGGQQQRVALARGLIMKPKVLLLDESLGALDLKLKKQMQIELKKIQKKLGITFIYVTHNQEEALTMSDRIVVINKGKIEQIDSPVNIYKKPKSLFVADFIGESNILKGIITKIDKDYASVEINNELEINIINKGYKLKEKVIIIIRPKDIRISRKVVKDGYIGVIKDNIYNGDITKFIININKNIDLKANYMDDIVYQNEEIVYIKFDINDLIILEDNNEKK